MLLKILNSFAIYVEFSIKVLSTFTDAKVDCLRIPLPAPTYRNIL